MASNHEAEGSSPPGRTTKHPNLAPHSCFGKKSPHRRIDLRLGDFFPPALRDASKFGCFISTLFPLGHLPCLDLNVIRTTQMLCLAGTENLRMRGIV